ncbi:hypothetical protein A5893_17280 [Pedobacter psychrophilus]|uniref:HTH araC/xylS-type domain-containing protein n=1 Tax=Pedobacter psychrophilus TaxID=1826909 RepID=A0A179DR13_9SPHI|nr:AraC family transcriptional regulator [Pedobacter psychrophilus]OAQ43491.1 hypothetical protein A5893_17280 [Pedobacter psychrophilus]
MESKNIQTLQFKLPDEKRILFEIISLSNLDREIPPSIHRHNFYEIVIITKGETKQIVDFKTYNVTEKEVLIIPKGSIHQGSFKEKLEGYIVLFTPEFLTKEQGDLLAHFEIFNASINTNLLTFDNEEWNDVLQFFTLLQKEYFQNKNNKNTLRFLFLAFATKINDFMPLNYFLKSYQKPALKFFFDLLETHFKNEHLVNFYANKLKITSKILTQTLFNATGKNTLQLINERLILEAKRELLFSSKSIKEIAFELGFEDQLYFSKLFKKNTTFAPQEFKKEFA